MVQFCASLIQKNWTLIHWCYYKEFMKKLILTITILLFSKNSFADSITLEKKLQVADSIRIYEALLSLGKTATQDPNDPEMIIKRTQFVSSDKALIIACENKYKGMDIGTECTVSVDSTLSEEKSTAVNVGLVGNVILVNLYSEKDLEDLKRSLVKPLNHFKTTELVEAALSNGDLRKFPRMRIDCEKDLCQLAVFP